MERRGAGGRRYRHAGTRMTVFLTALILTVVGCAVNQEPFNDFTAAVGNTQEGTMNCVQLTYDFSRNDFIKEFAREGIKTEVDHFDELLLSTNGSELGYEGTPPLFCNINRARVALEKLNAAFSAYSVLLQTLAGTKSFSADELKNLSGNINAVATAAWKLSGEDAVGNPGELIGTTFSTAADLYLRNRIKSHLQAAIIGNQLQVEKYAKQGTVLIGTLRKVLIQSYGTQFTSLHMKWKEAKTAEAKETLLAAVLDLNLKYLGAFELLAALEDAYGLLPDANRDLASSVADGDAALPGLNNLSRVSAELKIRNADLVDLMTRK